MSKRQRKTHCKHGHEYAVHGRDSRGACEECNRESFIRYWNQHPEYRQRESNNLRKYADKANLYLYMESRPTMDDLSIYQTVFPKEHFRTPGLNRDPLPIHSSRPHALFHSWQMEQERHSLTY